MILFTDSDKSSESRENPANDTSNAQDFMILHLIGDYGGAFPWQRFLPAVQSGNKK
ncbi:MAG: hypothetical protein OEM01_04285 [Desulfobulbaceae bacterium]|nr:hypothetical protein [Desulfobulbaceae bacterium]